MRALALAIVVVLTGACAAETTSTIGARIAARGPVLAVGDSILVGARDFGDLEARMTEQGWEPAVVAEEGRTVPWAIEQLDALERVPPTVVVVLGSNPGPDLGEFPAEITAMMDELVARGADRVWWVPPHHADPERYAERAEVLEEAAADDPRLRIVPWPTELDRNPSWLSGDGLHLTGEGYGALAAFIVASLAG